MNRERWARLCVVFEGAIDLSGGEREQFVEENCGEDAELRGAVMRMLAAHERDADFLEEPALNVTAKRLGPWKIEREIGRGGMGIVFLGERADGLYEQKVAIKVVPGGVHTETAVLARLEHPSIARLLDAGVTAEGFPFLVMEYVDGVALDEWVEKRKPTEAERLAVFRGVCAAVQYAHQNLVLHRDLKPSNILITRDGVPKLLDFGIAKQLDLADRVTTIQAATPEYASPEQLLGEPLSTASDVYSLGVLLHVLLAGRVPKRFEGSSLRSLVAEIDKDLTAAVGVDGDLGQIIRKAIQRWPKDRYASPAELAEEIERYRQGLPVRAQPLTWTYRSARFLKRNKEKVAVSAFIVLALSATTLFALFQARTADRRFQEVRRLANAVLYDIHDSVAGLPGSNPARLLLSERALEYLEALSAEAQSDPEVWTDIASGYLRLGDVQGGSALRNLGQYDEAQRSYRKAREIAERLVREDPEDPAARKLYLRTQPPIVIAELRSANRKEGFAMAERHLAESLSFAKDNPNDADTPRMLADANFQMALAYVYLARHDEALKQWLETAKLFEALPPGDYVQRRKHVGVYQFICDEYLRKKDLARAREYSDRAVRSQQKLREEFPELITARMDLALCHYQAARVLATEGNHDAAVAALDRMIPIREELVRLEPTDVLGKSWLAAAHTNRGEYLEAAGRNREAAESLETGLRIYHPLAEVERNSQRFQAAVAESEAKLATVYTKLSQSGKACALFAQASRRYAELSAEAKAASLHPEAIAEVDAALKRCSAQ